MTTTITADIETLKVIIDDYSRSYETGDTAFFEQLLAEDFVGLEPDFSVHNKKEFVQMMSKPRQLSNIRLHDLMFRTFDDFAVVHGKFNYKDVGGVEKRGTFTDDFQKRDGKWLCVAATVIAERGLNSAY